jgi:hypothetical protein
MRLAEKAFMRPVLFAAMALAMTMHSGSTPAQQASAGQNDITAIDTLLEPDATMVQHATAANAQLLKSYPKGYTLGGAHAPHVSICNASSEQRTSPKCTQQSTKFLPRTIQPI